MNKYHPLSAESCNRRMRTAEESFKADTLKGEAIIEFLDLRKVRGSSNYPTAWGSKTPAGLYRSLKRFLEEMEGKE